MKSKLSKSELIILIGFVFFFFVIAIVWFIQNRNKLVAEWRKLQNEIRSLRYKIMDFSAKEAKQKRKAFFALTFLKIISLIIFFSLVQFVHWQFNLNPLASFAGTFSVIVGLYYMTIYLISNTIYSFTEFLHIVHNGLTKLFLKAAKVELIELKAIELRIESKQVEASAIKEKLRACLNFC